MNFSHSVTAGMIQVCSRVSRIVSPSAMVALLIASAVDAQVTERVSVGTGGGQAVYGAQPGFGRYISSDGRFVVFASQSDNLVLGDTHPSWDLFLRDRQNGTTELVDVNSAGVQASGTASSGQAISDDGRYVVFTSLASDLVPSDTNGVLDTFLRDRVNGTTERISLTSTGTEGNDWSVALALTNDGRYVVFISGASNLVPGDTNGVSDVFVRDRQSGTTERVSISTGGGQADGDSTEATISADGRYVEFMSYATNLVGGDTNGRVDAFVHDRLTGVTERVSVASNGTEGDGECWSATISNNGRFVAFSSWATNLVPGDTNLLADVFLRDLQSGTTERISLGTGGAEPNGYSSAPWVSTNGRLVAFTSFATNLIPGGTAWGSNVFVYDRQTSSTEFVSTMAGGGQSNGASSFSTISSSGRFVAFRSSSSNLVPGDTNAADDVFIHDRGATGFTSICDPGHNSVIACPCGNPPSGAMRGCDNSASTGGATIGATGIAYLSLDSLVFTTYFEKPNATSILLQGTAPLPNGIAFGQGVRCAGGTLKRMYVKTAVNGSITAPDPNTNDLAVSARSTALGIPITPGDARYYFVYYRDSTVLGGCPALSTFNATQTGSVNWWP